MQGSGATWQLYDRVAVASAWDDAANSDVIRPADAPLPDDVETLKAMLLAERQAYGAKFRNQALQIEKLEHQIAARGAVRLVGVSAALTAARAKGALT